MKTSVKLNKLINYWMGRVALSAWHMWVRFCFISSFGDISLVSTQAIWDASWTNVLYISWCNQSTRKFYANDNKLLRWQKHTTRIWGHKILWWLCLPGSYLILAHFFPGNDKYTWTSSEIPVIQLGLSFRTVES